MFMETRGLRGMRRFAAACAAMLLAGPALAQDGGAQSSTIILPDVEVIGATPLMGAGTPVDEVPYRVQVTDSEEIQADIPLTIYDFVNRNMAGASVVDVQNNPYQQNFNYRGYVAGPLLGESVGIAAFMNGVRINDPFGDVVQSDLFPEMAISRLELGNANPAFGFNALGGALAIQTFTGKSYQGAELAQSLGSFGRLRTMMRAGTDQGIFNGFVALQRDEEDGWRDDSPSELTRFFADVGAESERATVNVNLSLADNDLIGNGLTPIQLYEVNDAAFFTSPDQTKNTNMLISGQSNIFVNDRVSIQANAYVRRLRRNTLNGDEIDAEDCEFGGDDDDDDEMHAHHHDDDDDDDDMAEMILAHVEGALGGMSLLPPGYMRGTGFVCGEDDDDDEMAEGGHEEEEEESEYAILVDDQQKAIASFMEDDDYIAYGALNRSTTHSTVYGGSVQALIDLPLGNMDHQLIIGSGVDRGRTEFSSNSELGGMLANRAVTGAPGGLRYNTGVVEIEYEHDDDDDDDNGHHHMNGHNDDDDDDSGHMHSHDDDDDDDHMNGMAMNGNDDDDDDDDEGAEHGEAPPVDLVAENTYFRVYVSDTFHVNDRLAVTAAVAANHAEIKLIDESIIWNEHQTDLNGKHSFFSINPAIGATYRLSDGAAPMSVYGGFRQANRAPSPAELSCADPEDPCSLPNAFVADPPLDQVVSHTFEAGLRGRLSDGRMGPLGAIDWNASAFVATNSDDILFVATSVAPTRGYFRNVGDTRRQGFELSLDGRRDRIDWFVNYSYVDATFESPFNVVSEAHPNADDGRLPVEVGDKIPGVPAHTLGAGIAIEPISGLRLGSSVLYRSGVYRRADEGNFLGETDGYTTVNLNASYRVSNWLEVFARAENIFNEDYETFGIVGEAGDEVPISELNNGEYGPIFLSPGQPFAAMFGVRLLLN